MTDKPKNMAASVRQRLLNKARAGEGQDFQRLLVRYAIERLLYRLSQSTAKKRFVLKGAMLFAVWAKTPFRSTGDLDLLGSCRNDPETLRKAFAEICRQSAPDDGLAFDNASIRVEALREDEEYEGARIRLDAKLGTAVIPLQVDIGFGDVVHPAPKIVEYPSLIAELPAPRLLAYPPETVIAEKLEAAVRFDALTSRLKDHYDIWALSRIFRFDKAILSAAIAKTFKRRGSALPISLPAPFTVTFAESPLHAAQWQAFLRRTSPTLAPPPFADLIAEIRTFLKPVLDDPQEGTRKTPGTWDPAKGWV
jgi:hypothetical protein